MPSRSTRTGRRSVAVRTGAVAVAAALTAAGGSGVAQAAPASVTGRLGAQTLSLDGEQLAQLRSQVAALRDGARPAGLPDSGPTSFSSSWRRRRPPRCMPDALPSSGAAGAAAAATQAEPAADAAAQEVIGELPAAVPEAAVLDGNADGVWDYLLTTLRLPNVDRSLVVVLDRSLKLLPSAAAPYAGPLSLVDGLVDTNVFDTDVQSVSGYRDGDDVGTVTGPTGTELSGPMSFHPLHPGLRFTGPAGGTALLLPATDGTTLTVTQDPATYAADVAIGGVEKGAMVVLPHNDSGTGRGQSVPVAVGEPALPATVVSVPAG